MTQDPNVVPPVSPVADPVVPPEGGSYAPPAVQYTAVASDKDARMWGMLAHLSALIGFVIPFGSIIGPLVVWLIKKNEIPFVDDQGKESLNFQITVAIALIACFLLIFVVIGFLLLPVVAIANLVFIIIASVKANNGEAYRYPFALRLIK